MLKFIPSGPVNRHPLLVSEGFPPGAPLQATPHTYLDTRKEPDPEFGELRPQWRQYFQCDVTGTVRVFGCQGPNYTADSP